MKSSEQISSFLTENNSQLPYPPMILVNKGFYYHLNLEVSVASLNGEIEHSYHFLVSKMIKHQIARFKFSYCMGLLLLGINTF